MNIANVRKLCVRVLRNTIFAARFPGAKAIVHSIPERIYDAAVAGHVLGMRCIREATVVNYGERRPENLPGWFRTNAAFKPRYVYRLGNCNLDVKTGAVSAGGLYYHESIGHYRLIIDLFSHLPDCSTFVQVLEPCCLLLATGYYHFVAESLANLLLCLEDAPNVRIVVSPASARFPFISEYLDLLREQKGGALTVLPMDQGSRLHCQDYRFAGLEGNSGFVHPDEVRRLRKCFLPSARAGTAKRIYVSRRYARRAFSNAAAVEAVAQRHGFTVVYPEKMSVREQINLFYGADAIIGDHGAGLVNLIYGNPGAQVLELFSPRCRNDCFFRLATTVGLTHRHLIASDEGGWGRVPLDALEEELRALS